jgi:hypothetical protein
MRRGCVDNIIFTFPKSVLLYPKMREAKQQRREVVLVRDRLYIDGEQYFPPEDRFLESEDNIINTTPIGVFQYTLEIIIVNETGYNGTGAISTRLTKTMDISWIYHGDVPIEAVKRNLERIRTLK